MHKAIVMMLLTVASTSAAAEWVSIGGTGGMTTYMDPATVRRTGNMAEMWTLSDYTTLREDIGKPYRSVRGLQEYDCKEGQSRTLSKSFHSGNRADGEIVSHSSEIGNWEPVSPQARSELPWKLVCRKK